MRLWSICPSCLDQKGLVALWREGLLAQAVLAGETKGYRSHPQLLRFSATSDPLSAMSAYLRVVHTESLSRGYRFDETKIKSQDQCPALIPVTTGQVAYEFTHLQAKLRVRDPQRLNGLIKQVHPLFYAVEGLVEPWEVIKQPSPFDYIEAGRSPRENLLPVGHRIELRKALY